MDNQIIRLDTLNAILLYVIVTTLYVKYISVELREKHVRKYRSAIE